MTALPVLLVPGAWHGAWSWAALQAELDQLGVPSYAIDLPGRGLSSVEPAGLSGDAAAVRAALERIATDTVLVGHSYAGAVVGEASDHPLVDHVVYVAAFALRTGESVNGFLRSQPRHHVSLADAMRPNDDGSISLDTAHAAALYRTAPAPVAAASAARWAIQPAETFTDPVTREPFDRVATTYVLCERDDAVHPVHQEALAARCDQVVRLDRDHFPMLAPAGELAAAIAGIELRAD